MINNTLRSARVRLRSAALDAKFVRTRRRRNAVTEPML